MPSLDTYRKGGILIPALFLSWALAQPMPAPVGGRETAGYFQSLAIARDGLASYTYLTPEESLSSIHLHSLLSAPLVEIGYPAGGRLVSLLAAIAATALVALLARRWGGDTAGVLAPGLLWMQPLFQRFASRYWPETISIALTAGALYATARTLDATENSHRKWYVASLALIVLGITNHMWEASIALPVALWYASESDYPKAAGVAATTTGSILVVRRIKHWQPAPGSLFNRALWNHTDAFLSIGWWIEGWNHPINVFMTFILPCSLLALAATAVWAIRTRETAPIVLSSWFASGATIPILLAGGYTNITRGRCSPRWLFSSLLSALARLQRWPTPPQHNRLAEWSVRPLSA